ncbi:O-antigen ligase family protein [Aureispira anguillae]|uniref:O-antigen ligase family protein n=1 Tax=Aureispira anguillae TaxID=2864201 RepID=A0A916DWJ6_9BACT|nr:O-antigen ligase family protein [Aureispira anguillae]BDS15546.1 O-antigen ligase family protein [Aureispira anguillae]
MLNKPQNVHIKKGADILYVPLIFVGLIGGLGIIAQGLVYNWMLTCIGLVGLPIGLFYLYKIFQNPRLGMWSVLVYCFVWSLIARYLFAYTRISLPFGLGVDGLLFLTFVAMIFSGGAKAPYTILQNKLVVLTFLWFFFVFLQLFNPQATSKIAWFYAMRCYALYLFFTVILTYMLLNQKEDLDRFFLLFVGFSIFGGLYGAYQLNIGLNYADSIFIQPKLDRHMLFGKLRVFSFYENAGQAGVSQAHAGLIANILFIHEKRRNYKIYYCIGMLACYYGMAISGTRGALVVPIIGMGVYLVWCRKPIVTISGIIVGAVILFLLVFTTVGQSNYTINRMRTAFDPNDPSFQYRMEARAHYQEYMNKHAFGWGIGTAGYWGNRFNGEDNVMTGTDGGYVQLQAEIGIVGLYFYWFYYSFILGATFWMLLKLKDSELYPKVLALCCGIMGLLAANYGNSVIYQLPSNLTISMSLVYIWMARSWALGEDLPKFESKFNTKY